MCVNKKFDKVMSLLERMPDPNTSDVLGKSLLEYFVENRRYEEVIRLLKMGAFLSQDLMLKCLKSNLYIEDKYTRKMKSYNLDFMKLLIGCGLKPLSQEQLLHLLDQLYHFDYSKLSKIIQNMEDFQKLKMRILLAFEKRLKMMYSIYIGSCFS